MPKRTEWKPSHNVLNFVFLSSESLSYFEFRASDLDLELGVYEVPDQTVMLIRCSANRAVGSGIPYPWIQERIDDISDKLGTYSHDNQYHGTSF